MVCTLTGHAYSCFRNVGYATLLPGFFGSTLIEERSRTRGGRILHARPDDLLVRVRPGAPGLALARGSSAKKRAQPPRIFGHTL